MESEILAIKLCELDRQMGSMHGRILELEHAPEEVLQQEIDTLRREYREKEKMLRNNLHFSRASSVAALYRAYTEVENVLERLSAELRDETGGKTAGQGEDTFQLPEPGEDAKLQDGKPIAQGRAASRSPEPGENAEQRVKSQTDFAEEKLLFAEYALDFAMQAANRALLISLEAAKEERKCSKTVLKP